MEPKWLQLQSEINPVPSSVDSAETAELWVVFPKVPFSFGFFLLRSVRDALAANRHVIFVAKVSIKHNGYNSDEHS